MTDMSRQPNEAALRHRTIRHFKPVPIDVKTLENAARATASSEYLQSFTLIHVTDPNLRHAIAAISGSQVLQQENGELFIFVVDTNRDIRIARRALAKQAAATSKRHADTRVAYAKTTGSTKSTNAFRDAIRNIPRETILADALSNAPMHTFTNWNAFLAGVLDATLAAQNMLGYAEANGLGGCYLGSILNDPRQLINLLHLPKYTFPILGLILGVPADEPKQKPRLPSLLTVGENGYPSVNEKEWNEAVDTYDRTVAAYYDSRDPNPRAETFSALVVRHLTADQHHRDDIGTILREQGFELE